MLSLKEVVRVSGVCKKWNVVVHSNETWEFLLDYHYHRKPNRVFKLFVYYRNVGNALKEIRAKYLYEKSWGKGQYAKQVIDVSEERFSINGVEFNPTADLLLAGCDDGSV
jgi:hypothetical protein